MSKFFHAKPLKTTRYAKSKTPKHRWAGNVQEPPKRVAWEQGSNHLPFLSPFVELLARRNVDSAARLPRDGAPRREIEKPSNVLFELLLKPIIDASRRPSAVVDLSIVREDGSRVFVPPLSPNDLDK